VNASGLTIDAKKIEALSAYYMLLARWTRRINLTSLPLDAPTEPTLDRLFIEPLLVANRLLPGNALWFDAGSGGGSPAIPMRLFRPASRLTMVESRSRKTAFLREVVRQLALIDVAVVESRFEALERQPGLRGVADVVTVRAVRTDEVLFTTAAHLLRPAGALIVFGTAEVTGPDFKSPERVVLGPTSSVLVFRRV